MAEYAQLMNYLNARPKLVVRPHLLALAAFLASAPVYPPNSHMLGRLAADTNGLGNFQLAMALACIAAAIALIMTSTGRHAARRHDKAPRRLSAIICATGYVCTQAVCIILLAREGDQTAALAPLGALAGILVVPVILAWVRHYAMDLRNVMFYGTLACAISSLVNWIASLLPDASASIVLIVMAAIGAIAPSILPAAAGAASDESRRSPREVEPGAPANQAGHGSPSRPATASQDAPSVPGFAASVRGLLSIIWLPLLGFLLYVFMTTLYTFSSSEATISTEFSGSIIASALTLGTCLAPFRTPLVILVDRLVIPVCIAVCLALGSFPPGSPVFILGAYTVYVPLVFMSIYALSSLIVVSSAGEFPAPFIVGVVLIASNAIALFATFLSQTFGAMANLGSVTWTVVCIYFAIAIIGLGCASWRKATSPATADDAVDTSLDAASKIGALYLRQIVDLAQAHGLTERESQILFYLGHGYNSTYVAQCLFISPNTVRTHARGIYRKLGVSSRAELLALVERTHR